MRAFLGLLGLTLAALSWPMAGEAQEKVTVGGYVFPPYVENTAEGEIQGVALDLIEALNSAQDRYRFEFFLTAPNWRYGDFENGIYDVIFFEDPSWGWISRDIAFDATRVFLRDSEVYITSAEPGRGQAYFNDIADKRIGVVQGYHYGFADFQGDTDALRAKFDLTFVSSPAATIQMILAGRTELSVVTRSYLNRYLAENPGQRDKLLISEKTDQVYRHRALVRPEAPLDSDQIEALLTRLADTGELADILGPVGLAERSAF